MNLIPSEWCRVPEQNPAASDDEFSVPPADNFFLSKPPGHLADGGPRYVETPADPYAPEARAIAEPWNTVTAFAFVVIVAYWAVKLRGRFRAFPFVTACLPVLLVGGVGGTMYHACRTQFAYFLADVLPISLLALAGAIYLIVRLGRGSGWLRIVASIAGVIVAYLFLNGVVFRGIFREALATRPNMAVNLSYASLAAVILLPLLIVLARMRFRHGKWILAALFTFGHAWFFRLIDGANVVDWSMGTHWLWHLFGAATTAFLFEYFYRIERETI